jgi:acyl transferase domain-containing protein
MGFIVQRSTVPSKKSKVTAINPFCQNRNCIRTATANLAGHLKQYPEINLADIAYTLSIGRVGFNYRRIVVVNDVEDAVNTLTSTVTKRVFSNSGTAKPHGVVFMFSGQGSQYVNMGRELYENEPYFKKQVDRCCAILQLYLDFDLRDVLYPSADQTEAATEKLKQTAITQPVLFVIEYALAQLWISWGITPVATIGHSIGEYVAATLAEVFTLEDALALVVARGQLMDSLPPGAMLAVPLSENEVQPLLTGTSLQIGVINSPSNCVVSGTKKAIEAFEKQLAEREIEGRRLHTSHAFHSEMMEPILETFTEKVKQIRLNAPVIPFVSNVTGTWITEEQATSPSYYAQHLRQTVRFADGIKQLFEKSDDLVFIEVGPGKTLSTLAKRHPNKRSEQIILNSIRHPQEQESDVTFLLNTLGQIWLAGVAVDWFQFYGEDTSESKVARQYYRVPLPTYPFDRKRYWIEPTKSASSIDTRSHEKKKSDIAEEDLEKNNPVELSSPTELDRLPQTPKKQLEKAITQIWQQVLGIENIKPDDNFFELGGDSLVAVQLLTKLRKVLDSKIFSGLESSSINLSLHLLFEAPTIASLTEYFEVAQLTAQELPFHGHTNTTDREEIEL